VHFLFGLAVRNSPALFLARCPSASDSREPEGTKWNIGSISARVYGARRGIPASVRAAEKHESIRFRPLHLLLHLMADNKRGINTRHTARASGETKNTNTVGNPSRDRTNSRFEMRSYPSVLMTWARQQTLRRSRQRADPGHSRCQSVVDPPFISLVPSGQQKGH